MRYAVWVRYAQGGGVTAERRAFREQLRMQAAERFAQGEDNVVIAHELRVSIRSVQRWRMAWVHGGRPALVSKGPASLPRLSDELFVVLETELDKGVVAHGVAGSDLDACEDQDADRAPVPQELHHPGRGGPAAPARLELPGAGPPGGRA